MKAEDLTSNSQAVTNHIQKLPTEIAATVEFIRQLILSNDKEIGERIKWNNPSFFYAGNMKTFDAKEYKREIAVFNLFKNRIMLVFPSGEKVDDGTGFLSGDFKDGRRLLVFENLVDAKSKQKNLQKIIKSWLKQLEK